MEKIFTSLFILFGIYILVMIMIFADLWSGTRKAKSIGKKRTSYDYRRSVSKAAQYYNLLIALTIIDAMQMSVIWYLEQYYDHHIWFFPFITLGGAFVLCCIEVKSIYEKAEDKVRMDDAGQMIGKIIANKDDFVKMAEVFSEYMHKNQESNKKETQNTPNTERNEE